jgi:glycosyltransferase involved in cell wall biosynthesis
MQADMRECDVPLAPASRGAIRVKQIVLHDYFEAAEGGGRLALTLARQLAADLAYGFKAPGHPFFQGGNVTGHEFAVSSQSRVPLWKQYRLARDFAGKTGFVRHYERAVYSGFYAPLAVLDHPAGHNVYYCHTPPRFIYDQRQFYLDRIPAVSRPLLKSFSRFLQPRYEQAVARMDVVLTNSEHVRQRIRHFLGVDAVVVHPPCDVHRFQWVGQGGYYLSMARLDPLKRVDRLVQAFLRMPDKKLVVCSGGPEFNKLKKIAAGAENIVFTGWCSEADLTALVGNALAVLYIPRDEDFGMTPVEAMAAGKPVIGVAAGGMLETVVPGENGLLLAADPTVAELCEAVASLDGGTAAAMRGACRQRALLFTEEVFLQNIKGALAL